MRVHSFALVCLAIAAFAPSACSDPVRERAEAELPPEDPEGPSPNHRRGQPCLLCHDEQGGARPEMAVAGTVYKDPTANAEGAENVEIQFVDASGGGPLNNPTTFVSGNFFVLKTDWPDLTYPFKVRLSTGGNTIPMRSTVNREGSCNFCHRPTPAQVSDLERELARRSTTQIFVAAGTP